VRHGHHGNARLGQRALQAEAVRRPGQGQDGGVRLGRAYEGGGRFGLAALVAV